jgi:hypothetical protein
MRSLVLCAVLPWLAGPASAQLNSGSYWEHAGLRTHGGMRLFSGATFHADSAAVSSAAIAASVARPFSAITLGLHAGALHGRHGLTSAGATVSAQLHAGRSRLEIRAGAAAAPDEHRGVSVTTLGAFLSRSGLSVSVRSNLLPALRARSGDSLVVRRIRADSMSPARDTTYWLNYITEAQPRRLYTDAEIAYHGAYSRLSFDAAVGYRLAVNRDNPHWARVGVTYRLTHTLALGGSYGREPGTPWLQSKARSAGTVFVRIDPPQRSATSRPARTRTGVQQLHITTNGATTFTIAAPAAQSVEIAGTFTNWEPLALTRAASGSWSVSVPLGRGVYQIALRIDGGRWHAPPGLATVPDEFGGETGVFEVR